MSEKTPRKILIVGHGGCGKDTFCEILRGIYGMTFASSSRTACDIFIYKDVLSHLYHSADECYDDRRNRRDLWCRLIEGYNLNDKAKLARDIYKDNLIYNGIRRREEFDAIKAEFKPLIVWIDASGRLPDLNDSTLEIKDYECDWIVNNNGGMELLKDEAWLFDEKFGAGGCV